MAKQPATPQNDTRQPEGCLMSFYSGQDDAQELSNERAMTMCWISDVPS